MQNTKSPRLAALKAAVPCTLPVLTGYLVLGLAYGIYARSMGLAVWCAPLMALVVYGGSLEFVAVSLLVSPFAPAAAFFMALLIQARHLFYGLAMLERYRTPGLRRSYQIFALTDETFSVVYSAQPPAGVDEGWFRFFISLLDHGYWVGSAALGSVLGAALPFDTTGIDFVMTALFTVIFLEQSRTRGQKVSALAGLGVSAACLALFGADSFLLPAMAGILIALLALRGRIEPKGGAEE